MSTKEINQRIKQFNPTYQKHLTLDERDFIEDSLKENWSITKIACSLFRHPSTVSKEIRKHRIILAPNSYNSGSNLCINKYSCKLKNVCGKDDCRKSCKDCYICNKKCDSFIKNTCSKNSKPPYACNGCQTKRHCRLEKFIYRARDAQAEYEFDLSESRIGINLTPIQLCELDSKITPLLKKGQPLNHILTNNPDMVPYTSRTIYNYIERGYLSATNLDLPRKVKYKPRKKNKMSAKVEAACRTNRTYVDFNNYLSLHPNTSIVEMDVVEGKKGGKVLLTMLFRSSKLMLAFLLEDKTSDAVCQVFDYLQSILGTKCFKNTFQLILTDNGSEFSNPSAIEHDTKGKLRTRLFYCDPHASWQKGILEHNHSYIRYISKKGKSFDQLTQEKVTLMINHINSVAREDLNNQSPMDLAKLLVSKKVLEKLYLTKVPANEIILKPSLLKK